jgi:hypothetical protein
VKEPVDDWLPLPKKGASDPWRPLKWGLIGAVSAVAGAVLLAALRGFFFGQVSSFYGTYEPGWDAAYARAGFMLLLGGLPISGLGFAGGIIAGLVKSGHRSGG